MIKRKLKPCEICGKPVFKIGAKVCSINCSLEYNALHPELLKNFVEEQQKKEIAKRYKIAKDSVKLMPRKKKKAKEVFQKWARLRNDYCMSCGKPRGNENGGHWWKAELYSGLIFHPDNVWGQCVYCNKELDGNTSNYRIGLIKVIGRTRVEWLENNKDRLKQYKYSLEQYEHIIKTYTEKLKNNDFTPENFDL